MIIPRTKNPELLYLYFSPGVNSSGMFLGARLGYMKRKRLSTYLQFLEMPVKPYNIFKTSLGFNYHIIKDYTQSATLYIGGRFEMNNVTQNSKPFFNYAMQWGFEFMTKNRNRFFTELSFQKTIFNVHNGSGIHFTLGIRFGKEYKPFYKRLNTLRRLQWKQYFASYFHFLFLK